MGYSTDFTGELTFSNDPTASELAYLNKFLGEDRRDLGFADDSVYENGKFGGYWYHIDLELLDDFNGIKWNGAEKTYDLESIINWVTHKMHESCYTSFKLEGELLAQGERHEDRYRIVMKDGVAHKIDFPRIGQKICCPHCKEEFTLEG